MKRRGNCFACQHSPCEKHSEYSLVKQVPRPSIQVCECDIACERYCVFYSTIQNSYSTEFTLILNLLKNSPSPGMCLVSQKAGYVVKCVHEHFTGDFVLNGV